MRNFLNEIGSDIELEKRVLANTENELKKLPCGQLKQSGHGKGIYLKDNGIYKSGAKQGYLIEQIRRRKFLEKRRDVIKTNLHWQSKLLKHYNSYSDDTIENMMSPSYINNEKEVYDEPQRIPLENMADYHSEVLSHRTTSGELRRSKSEVIISMLLDAYGVNYTYEQRLYWPFGMSLEAEQFKVAAGLKDSVLPDFTIFMPDGERMYWEHLGMLNQLNYAEEWMRKMLFYHWMGIDQGRNLIVTTDDCNGHIDQITISEIIRTRIIKKY